MTRERKQSVIRKPFIDEESALRFATPLQPETSSLSSKNCAGNAANVLKHTSDTVQVTVTLSRETHARLVREAARKKRSVEEMLQRHLSKHYGKE